MTIDNIPELSNTATSNTDIIGANVAENSAMAAMNNAIRNMGKMLADFYDDIGAVNTVAGTADAITVTTKMAFASLQNGHTFTFIAGSTNTSTVTLAADGLAAKAVVKSGDTALAAGDIVSGNIYTVVYNTALDSGSAGWFLMNASGGGDFLADGSVAMTGDLNTGGQNIDSADSIYLNEKSTANADITADGQFWVKDDTPNTPMFTDDTGTDFSLNVGGGIADYQVFTSSGTWIKPSGLGTNARVLVEIFAGGGAGGGGRSGGGGNTGGGGGGGGSGIITRYLASALGSSLSVTVGAGGVGVAGNGGTGGTSTFNGVSCTGGIGGVRGQPSSSAPGGVGGVANSVVTGGDIHSAAGGSSGTSQSNNGTIGLSAETGGGGGGGANGTTAGGSTAGGKSVSAGAGGASGASPSTGTVPSGGGGGFTGTSSSATGGNGARGEIRITVFDG